MKPIPKITIDKETLKEYIGGAAMDPATFSGTCGTTPFCTQGCPETWNTTTCGAPHCDDCWPD